MSFLPPAGRILATALVPGRVSHSDPADTVAMVSRESTVPVDREGKQPCHHCRWQSQPFVDFPNFKCSERVRHEKKKKLNVTDSCGFSFSPEVVPEERKHPGRDWGDAGRAALSVFHPVSVCLGPALRRLPSLAGHHHRSDQHRDAAVRYWCSKSELCACVYMYVSTHAGTVCPHTSAPPYVWTPYSHMRCLSRGQQDHASLFSGPLHQCSPIFTLGFSRFRTDFLSLCVRLTHLSAARVMK